MSVKSVVYRDVIKKAVIYRGLQGIQGETGETGPAGSGITIADTGSVELTLTGDELTADVLAAGVDHDSLQNYLESKHFTQAEISIPASQVSDFDTEVSNNIDVSANTSARHAAATVTDTATIDLTLTGQDIKADIKPGGISHTAIADIGTKTHTEVDTHLGSSSNPHTVTKAQVGLGTVPDTDFTAAVGLNTAKISFDSTSSSRLANTSGTNTGDQDLSGLEPCLDNPDVDGKILSSTILGVRSWINGVKETVLTGLSTATATAITVADNVLIALGKLQGQFTAHLSNFTHSDIAHTNRTALDNVSGTNTGDQDLSGYSTDIHSNITALDNVSGSHLDLTDIGTQTHAELESAISGKEPSFVKNSAFNKNFGTAAGTAAEGDKPALLAGRTGGQTIAGTRLNLYTDIGTDQYLNSDTNTFLGVGVIGAGNLAHATGDEGWYNVVAGNLAGNILTTGYRNVLLGRSAGGKLQAANNNTFVGELAGYYTNSLGALRTPQNSIAIGSGTKLLSSTDVNSIVIGYEAEGAGSNTVVVGNDSITETVLKGSVGIGLTPTANMPGLSIEAGLLTLKERTTPTADTNYGKIYTKSDNKLYFQSGDGTENEIAFV